jgi:hypothetical protein
MIWRMNQIPAGALRILHHLVEDGFVLFGNPSRDVPFFLLPTDLKRTASGTIDPPVARDCVELLKHGLIEPFAANCGDEGARLFRVSEFGLTAARKPS